MSRLPQVGETFAGFDLRRELARGAMGVVFEGHEPGLNRIVAVKVINPTWADDADYRRRFLREASALASAESPHIVHIHQYGEHEGVLFMCMQYVSGGDVAEAIKNGALSFGDVLSIGVDLAGALADAHAVGVLHRDVKPRNVLLRANTAEPYAYLCDFGVAHLPTSTVTLTNSVTGTVLYMAPELFDGSRPHPGVDLYALGCLLWECVTGHPPYGGSHAQIMYGHAHGPVPSLGATDATTVRLDRLITRLLAKDPDERPGDAMQVHRELRAIQAAHEVDGRPVEEPAASSPDDELAASTLLATARAQDEPPVDTISVTQLQTMRQSAETSRQTLVSAASSAGSLSGRRRRRVLLSGVAAVLILASVAAWSVAESGGPETSARDSTPTSKATGQPAPTPGLSAGSSPAASSTASDVARAGVVGDANGDRLGDVILMDKSLPGVRVMSVRRRLASVGEAARTPSALAVQGDFDGDGIVDVASVTSDVGLMVRTGKPIGATRQATGSTWFRRLALSRSASLSAADFTGDGRADVAVLTNDRRSVVRVLTSKDRHFADAARWLSVSSPGAIRGIAGDLNGDGKADLALLSERSGALRFDVALSTGSGFSTPRRWFSSSSWNLENTRPVVGDFDGDGRADLAIVENANERITLHLLRSGGTSFREVATNPVGSSYRRTVPVTSDVDGDGRADIVLVAPGPQVQLLRGVGDGFAALTQVPTSRPVESFAVVGRGTYISDD